MNYFFRVSILLLIFVFSPQAVCDHNLNEIELVTGLAKPPFILKDESKGLQLDLISAALALHGITPSFTPMPLGRNITGYQRWNIDGVITVSPDYKYPSMFVSDPYITYQNVAVSLVESNYSIKSISDLSSKSIVAFQNAKKFLGESYNDVVAYSLDYREIADQIQQIQMLFTGRTKVIILDINIFKFFVNQNEKSQYDKPFNIHYIFKERQYSAGLNSTIKFIS